MDHGEFRNALNNIFAWRQILDVRTTPVLDLKDKRPARQHHAALQCHCKVRGKRAWMTLSNSVGFAEVGHAGYGS